MIEKTILDYLSEKLNMPVYMERPDMEPDEFVLVEKTGSGLSDHIKVAHFAVQSYSRSLLRAASINELVKSAMLNITELNEICSAGLNSDYPFTDTSTKHYRYQAVFDLNHY